MRILTEYSAAPGTFNMDRENSISYLYMHEHTIALTHLRADRHTHAYTYTHAHTFSQGNTCIHGDKYLMALGKPAVKSK